MHTEKRLSYRYATLFLCIIVVILVGVSIFFIDRTSSALNEIYWKQRKFVVESISLGIEQAVDSIEISPQRIDRHIEKIALHIDRMDSTLRSVSTSGY